MILKGVNPDIFHRLKVLQYQIAVRKVMFITTTTIFNLPNSNNFKYHNKKLREYHPKKENIILIFTFIKKKL